MTERTMLTQKEVREQRAAGNHYASHDYGMLCMCCAAASELVGPVEFSPSGYCYNCGTEDDLESQREDEQRDDVDSKPRRTPRCSDCGHVGHQAGAMECPAPQDAPHDHADNPMPWWSER